MKNKTLYIFILGLIISACSLDEDPPYLVNESVYADAHNATSALNGIYESMAEYSFFSSAYLNTINRNSGFFVTTQGGQNKDNVNNSSICSLKPLVGDKNINRVWSAHYATIGRANDAILGISPIEGDDLTDDEMILNDIVGQAYFVRAFCYFNLVRLFGDVPLRLEPTSTETIHMGKTDSKTIYDQVISDAINATQYMNGAIGNGSPHPFAANMLLSKIYMQLATAPVELQDPALNYWQMAYDEAIIVYGQYELVDDFSELWDSPSGENTSESVFEIQFSELISANFSKEFTAQRYASINSWGWWQINAEVYDRHEAAYPGDTRIAATFLSEYVKTNNGNTFTTYPTNPNRGWWGASFPYPFKACQKDKTRDTWPDNRNVIVYRYADLLIMLAEISNELQNGEQLSYITELLARPSISIPPRAKYSMGQDAFTEAVMAEYAFELLGEGHDWYNNRRRGYAWFREYTIDAHNNYEKFKPAIDVTHETDEATVMFLPIPSDEINTNDEIDANE